MSLSLEWPEILLRLALAILAGGVLGINRAERGRAAGVRTTILVCVAAAVSMILVNCLLPLRGKESDSFISLDLMRLPLGILTGMGFIGAGAVLRKGDQVLGVTTAATLWLTTVIGLCLGSGRILLGLATLAAAVAGLWGLKRFEEWLPCDRLAKLTVRIRGDVPSEASIRDAIVGMKYRVKSWDVTYGNVRDGQLVTICSELRWRGRHDETEPPAFVHQFAKLPGIRTVRWSA